MSKLSFVPPDELTRIRNLPGPAVPRAQAFATACRLNALYMIARAGSGHVGTSFSCMDILAWLFLNEIELPERPGDEGDVFFSSKGHDAPGVYSVLIGMERLSFDKLHGLRRLGGLPGHPDVSTPWMVTNTGPLGMGISKAKGIVRANRMQGKKGRVFVLTGDGELQEGQIWESLATAVRDRMGEITVIVDRNKVQSDTWVDEVSDLGDLEKKFSAFGWHARSVAGHDLSEFGAMLDSLRGKTEIPKVLIADTLKGRGVSFMEPDAMDPAERLYKFHSGAPALDLYEKAVTELAGTLNKILQDAGAAEVRLESSERPPVASVSPRADRLVNAYSEALVRQGERNPNLVALDADLVLDCGIIPFRSRFPDRFVECGIAEQDMVSQAGAMALRGLLPVVHSFSCFLSTRPNEQIYNNETEKTKIIYVAPLAGLLPSGPGHSHQSVRDISAVGGMPNIIQMEPSCEKEVHALFDYCINRLEKSCYLRLTSIPVEIPFEMPSLEPELGRGVTLREGKSGAVIAYGPVMLSEAFRALEILSREHGIDLALINLPWLNRVDDRWLSELAQRYRCVFTIDNHYLAGGQGQMILARMAELGVEMPLVRRFGIGEVPLCGLNAEVLRAHRLDAESLATEMLQSLNRSSLALQESTSARALQA